MNADDDTGLEFSFGSSFVASAWSKEFINSEFNIYQYALRRMPATVDPLGIPHCRTASLEPGHPDF
ncbi:hypothetical protein [Ralstonia solanacearum]|uniref:hypothetical protein n=1 Tax=Ralstonia solanacearum TaxID=305 RepID=UPI000AD1DC78|nr:hypothetical protein [Ralstonia solanacearum]